MAVWLLVVLAAAAAGASLWRARAAGARAASLAEALVERESALAVAEKEAARRAEARRRRGQELGELRGKLEKARRRAQEAREERDAERRRADGLEAELARLRAQPRPPPPPPPPSRPDPALVAERDRLRGQVEELEARLAGLPGLEADALRAEREIARLRERAKTQDKLYTSLRLELEAKKDRLRTQQEQLERLRALRVALAEPSEGQGPEDATTRAT